MKYPAMREIYLVRAYTDAPVQAFATYSTAWLRKCELDAEYGNSATVETVPIEEYKMKSHDYFGRTARTTF